MSVRINSDFMYELFGELYYNKDMRNYTDYEVSTTESIQCLRKSFAQRKMPRRLYNDKIVILTFGDIVHYALREPLRNRGFTTEVEDSFKYRNVTMYMHCDAEKNDIILENKTISTMPNHPLTHHRLQVNTYLNIRKKSKGYISYLHKPSGIIPVFPVYPDEQMFKYVCLRGIRLSNSLQTNTMPEPEPNWLCRYCEYRDLCKVK